MSENKEKLPEGVTHFVASVVWVMAGLALVVALPGLLIVEPHDFQSAVQFAVAAATVFILASWARHASPKTTVDFEQERSEGTEVDLEIDNISCVALIAHLSNPDQDHTPGHARYEVHVGTGDIEPASLKDTFTGLTEATPAKDIETAHDRHPPGNVVEQMESMGLRTEALKNTTVFSDAWQFAHQLVRSSGSAFINFTGNNFWAATAERAALPVSERLKGAVSDENDWAVSADQRDRVTVERGGRHDLSIRWDFSQANWFWPMGAAFLVAAIFVVTAPWTMGLKLLAFSLLTAGTTGCALWVGRHHGEHSLTVSDGTIEYRRPVDATGERMPVDQLYEVHLHPIVHRRHRRGPRQKMLLLGTSGEPIYVAGELDDLKEVRRILFDYLIDTSGENHG